MSRSETTHSFDRSAIPGLRLVAIGTVLLATASLLVVLAGAGEEPAVAASTTSSASTTTASTTTTTTTLVFEVGQLAMKPWNCNPEDLVIVSEKMSLGSARYRVIGLGRLGLPSFIADPGVCAGAVKPPDRSESAFDAQTVVLVIGPMEPTRSACDLVTELNRRSRSGPAIWSAGDAAFGNTLDDYC